MIYQYAFLKFNLIASIPINIVLNIRYSDFNNKNNMFSGFTNFNYQPNGFNYDMPNGFITNLPSGFKNNLHSIFNNNIPNEYNTNLPISVNNNLPIGVDKTCPLAVITITISPLVLITT